MPELHKLEAARAVLKRRSVGQTILSAGAMPRGGPRMIRDLWGEGRGPGLASARFGSCRGGPAAA